MALLCSLISFGPSRPKLTALRCCRGVCGAAQEEDESPRLAGKLHVRVARVFSRVQVFSLDLLELYPSCC
jgi:hypothetical protein